MSNTLIVGSQRLYVVTPEGRAAASAEETCTCHYHFFKGMFCCCMCGFAIEYHEAPFIGGRGKRA